MLNTCKWYQFFRNQGMIHVIKQALWEIWVYSTWIRLQTKKANNLPMGEVD